MAIDDDYGKLLAALMKKELSGMGIDYIAVGGGGKCDSAQFKKDVKEFFSKCSGDQIGTAALDVDGERWVWAKKINSEMTDSKITYLDDKDNPSTPITRKIRLEVSFDKGVPSNKTLDFSRFALLAIGLQGGMFNTERMFFIDYVDHDPITKDATTKLVRDIDIEFPPAMIKIEANAQK